ncbi:MAG: hypothetical protein FD121_978 [Gallionellaceae bacterium]|nr:MAG: hypothetical protein FD121_978 [Gallionellaceae bacterium]
MQAKVHLFTRLILCMCLTVPMHAYCEEFDWSIGGYAGQHYDTAPAWILEGDARFAKQYMVAITATKTIWRSKTLPLSLEIDGMFGHQSGVATLQEIGIAPVVRWDGFPWNETLRTGLRLAPLGVSYTTSVSPLERGATGKGSRTLNLLLIELGFALPATSSKEVFVRLHHRCSIYNLLNDYGANGEDFLALGYRYRF